MATRAEKIAMIAAIGTGEPNTALEFRNLLTALLDPNAGTIITKDVSNAYITANFDGTGLGINEELGYAICNGANGTREHNGKVMVAYGTLFPVMGASGGSPHTVVVAHTHTTRISNVTGTNNNTMTAVNGGSGGGTSANNGSGIVNVSETGELGTNKNMQPYTVVLVTMKL